MRRQVQDAASAGGEAGAGYLGEDREFHQGRVVSFAAAVWPVRGVEAEILKRCKAEIAEDENQAPEEADLRLWLGMKIFEQEQTETAKWRDLKSRL